MAIKKHTEKVSADVFLSRHGVKYDGTDLPGTPAEIMASLVTLNATREEDEDGDLVNVVYHTEGFIPSSITANTFSSKNVTKQQTAMSHYFDTLKTGDLHKVHEAVDALNVVRQLMGGSEFVPASDLDIIAHQQNELGAVARQLASDRAKAEQDGVTFWWDTLDVYHDVNNYHQ